MKTCPFCAEKIRLDAIKCRFCGEFLQKDASDASNADGAPPAAAAEVDSAAQAAAKADSQSEAERVTKELLHNWKFARWFP